MVGKGWPPPATFDAAAHAATVTGSAIEMVSPVDPAYGLRVRRTVTLHQRAGCRSTPRTRRCRGRRSASRSGRSRSWCRPIGCSRCCPSVRRSRRASQRCCRRRRRISAPTDACLDWRATPKEKTMIATDADALLWVGPGRDLVIETMGTYVARGRSLAADRPRRPARGRRARADLHEPRRRRAVRRARAARPARRSRARPARDDVGPLPPASSRGSRRRPPRRGACSRPSWDERAEVPPSGSYSGTGSDFAAGLGVSAGAGACFVSLCLGGSA